MQDGTTITILLGGIWVTLIFIAGVGWRILKGVNSIADTVDPGDGTKKDPKKTISTSS